MTRVLVTGIGAVTPVGNDAPSTWQALLAGRSGIGPITLFDASQFDIAIAGEVRDFQPDALLPARELRHMDRYAQLGVSAALQAARDAGFEVGGGLGQEAGVVFSSGAGGYGLFEDQSRVARERGVRRISPFFLANVLPDAASGYIAMLLGATGPNFAVVSACATGASAIGEASEVIRRGDAEIMIAGGAEAPVSPVFYGAFAALRSFASPGDDPATACKPFDRRRDGFVVAEGAGAIVLESYDHARARSAPVYAELIGYGASNDAFDMVAAAENGRGPTLAMQMALRKAAIDPSAVGYVNAHGTGTPMNDRVETAALKRVFAEHAYQLAVSSTKALTGHMMGAAGAVEAIVTALALRDGIVPPTMHYQDSDPDCDLDYVPNTARPMPNLEYALTTSIGLGGHNAALIFKRL